MIIVPSSEAKRFSIFSKEVMIALAFGFASTNAIAASTFGSMLPGANCFSSMYCFISETVTVSNFF